MIKNEIVLTKDWEKIEHFISDLEEILKVKKALDLIKDTEGRLETCVELDKVVRILDPRSYKSDKDKLLAYNVNRIIIDYVNSNSSDKEKEDDEWF